MKHIRLCLSAIVLTALSFSLGGCKSQSTPAAPPIDSTLITAVQVSGDSAFAFVKAQCDLGPRNPNSAAIEKCGDYIVQQMQQYGLAVVQQRTTVKGWDGADLRCRNIIGAYKPEATDRIVLAAHYDTRPWADADPDESKHRTPIIGADDGASGVGVLLEIARNIARLNPDFGVDFICFDTEDYGAPYWAPAEAQQNADFWCLGSQYWARNPHVEGYKARAGILLDMVGGRDSRFHYEGFSIKYAQDVAVRLWDAARYADATDFFRPESGGFITDDHLPMNAIAGIPTVDVIPYREGQSFTPYWHTTGDTLDKIDPATLRAVAQTVMQYLEMEKKK